MSVDLTELMKMAADNEMLPPFVVNSITSNANFSNALTAALSKNPPAANITGEVVILAMLADDSGSMSSGVIGDTLMAYEAVMVAHNGVLKELRSSKLSDTVIVYTAALNRGVINAFTALEDAVDLDNQNYGASGGTPLYDQSFEFYTGLMLKAAEFMSLGRSVRVVSLVLSDGEDMGSSSYNAADCKKIIEPLVNNTLENMVPTVAMAVGINNGGVNFNQIFNSMGFKDIITYQLTRKDILAFCQTVSASLVRASQSATGFSAVANNPFAQP